MTCPKCDSCNTRVINSREGDSHIYRRRKCLDCGHRFTTYEYEAEKIYTIAELMVAKNYKEKIKNNELEFVIRRIVALMYDS